MVPDTTPGPDLQSARALGPQPMPMRLELNLPNLITLARLVCVPIAIWLIAEGHFAAAFWIFAAAGVSDAIDGYIAKNFDRRTPLGALLDPLADKALLTGVYLSLGISSVLPVWLVVLVVLRDSLILAGFFLLSATAAPNRFQPLFISKINTAVQIALIGFVLARLGLGIGGSLLTEILIVVCAVTTVWSGLSYLARCARMLLGWERPL
jgi:cardiolipin synthase (CMP-forming)